MSRTYAAPSGWSASIACLGILCLGAPAAQASGHLPPLPIPPKAFADFASCRAFLDETYRQDLASADSKPLLAEGGTVQILIDSKGPVAAGPSDAGYTVTKGRQFRRVDTPSATAIYSYSYETTVMQCHGSALTGTHEQGYHLDNYVPLAKDTPDS